MLDCGGRDEPFPEGLFNYVDILSPNEVRILHSTNNPHELNLIHLFPFNIQTEALRVLETEDQKEVTIENIKEKVMKKYPNLKVLLKMGSDGCHMIAQDFDLKIPTINNYNS